MKIRSNSAVTNYIKNKISGFVKTRNWPKILKSACGKATQFVYCSC